MLGFCLWTGREQIGLAFKREWKRAAKRRSPNREQRWGELRYWPAALDTRRPNARRRCSKSTWCVHLVRKRKWTESDGRTDGWQCECSVAAVGGIHLQGCRKSNFWSESHPGDLSFLNFSREVNSAHYALRGDMCWCDVVESVSAVKNERKNAQRHRTAYCHRINAKFLLRFPFLFWVLPF